MRVIPVLDLKGDVAVHAVRGERSAYAPVRSALAASAEPLALARAFWSRLGVQACYVADLDAIAGTGDHGPTVQAIAALGLDVWLDAGVATAADAERAVGQGASRVIVGTETLRDLAELPAIVAASRRARAGPVLSLDLRQGRLLGKPGVADRDPGDVAAAAWVAGIRAFIVLDLARVGSAEGVATETAVRLRRQLPAAEIVVGGGVRGPADLAALGDAGFDAALVASALHSGAITAADLVALETSRLTKLPPTPSPSPPARGEGR
jgi:phosphoribosylformimino-5-aminoimidazole carboxamide ribotide isomerase